MKLKNWIVFQKVRNENNNNNKQYNNNQEIPKKADVEWWCIRLIDEITLNNYKTKNLKVSMIILQSHDDKKKTKLN